MSEISIKVQNARVCTRPADGAGSGCAADVGENYPDSPSHLNLKRSPPLAGRIAWVWPCGARPSPTAKPKGGAAERGSIASLVRHLPRCIAWRRIPPKRYRHGALVRYDTDQINLIKCYKTEPIVCRDLFPACGSSRRAAESGRRCHTSKEVWTPPLKLIVFQALPNRTRTLC